MSSETQLGRNKLFVFKHTHTHNMHTSTSTHSPRAAQIWNLIFAFKFRFTVKNIPFCLLGNLQINVSFLSNSQFLEPLKFYGGTAAKKLQLQTTDNPTTTTTSMPVTDTQLNSSEDEENLQKAIEASKLTFKTENQVCIFIIIINVWNYNFTLHH